MLAKQTESTGCADSADNSDEDESLPPRQRMRAMPTRVLLSTIVAIVACGVNSADAQPEPLKSFPRVLPDESPAPAASPALEESYQGIDSIFPDRFGSAPHQRAWGYAGGRYVFGGEKMAPNGFEYEPYFSLDLNFNLALTSDRQFYGFLDTRFWAQRADDNITQGVADASKRQIDLQPGLAWNFYGRMEARVSAYGFNDLSTLNPPGRSVGFYGAALEGRYWFAGTDFDQAIYNFVSIGYYVADKMIGNDGKLWEPGAYIRWSYNIPLWEQRFYLYTIGEFIAERPTEAKWVWLDTGISCRPFNHYPMFDLRLGNEANIDIVTGRTLTTWYLGARFTY
jgi:hypothetical protein